MYKLMIVDDSVIIRNRIERSLGSLQLESLPPPPMATKPYACSKNTSPTSSPWI